MHAILIFYFFVNFFSCSVISLLNPGTPFHFFYLTPSFLLNTDRSPRVRTHSSCLNFENYSGDYFIYIYIIFMDIYVCTKKFKNSWLLCFSSDA